MTTTINADTVTGGAIITGDASGELGLQTAGTTRMTITSTGNVGIGTSSPNEKLMVAGAGKFTAGAVSLDQNGAYIDYSSSVARIAGQGSSGGTLAFYTNPNGGFNVERMRITAGGNLLIGATATNTSPARLYLAQGSDYSITLIGGSLTGNQAFRHWIGGTQYYIINDNNTGVYLNYGGTSWVANSDERLKTDLAPIINAAEKVSTLRAVTGRYKNDEEGKSRAFLIAQDVQKVLPEAVDASNPERLGVSYTDTIPLLVAAIQELKAEVDSLKSQLAAKG